MATIRTEQLSDIDKVRHINEQAFGQTLEATIVDRLRSNCGDILSLVAEVDDEIVGHIMFSPVLLESGDEKIQGMALGPMAVRPDFQNQGIGSQLVKEGLKQIKAAGHPFLIVLGHTHYYPRFGFKPASTFGFRCQWEGVPDEAFMAIVFDAAKVKDANGIVRYRSEFDEAIE